VDLVECNIFGNNHIRCPAVEVLCESLCSPAAKKLGYPAVMKATFRLRLNWLMFIKSRTNKSAREIGRKARCGLVLYTAKRAIKFVADMQLITQNNALQNILPDSQHCPDQPFAHEHERCDSSPPFKHIRLHDLLWRVSKLQTFPLQAGWRSTALVLWDIPDPPHVAEHSVHTDHGDMTQSTK